ncbi:MAG: hypothetical protein AAF360_05910 [Pseudomonadota bacterium]
MTSEARMADFIGRLLDETLDSIQESYLDQNDRIAAAAEAAAQTPEEIAALISDNDVAAALESPAFRGLDKEETRRVLAEREYALRQAVLERGFPRLVIDTGEITARTTFKLESETPAAPSAPTRPVRPAVPSAPARPGFEGADLRSLLLSRRPQTRDDQLTINVRPVTEANAGVEKTENLADFNLSLKFKVIY